MHGDDAFALQRGEDGFGGTALAAARLLVRLRTTCLVIGRVEHSIGGSRV
jgi:hypothetical protein